MSIFADFIKKLDANDEFAACQRAVTKHFASAAPASTAVDVAALAAKAGIQIKYADTTVFEGSLSWDNNGVPQIVVTRRANPRRQRFTIAHELGHWILQEELLEDKNRPLFRGVASNRAAVVEEERLANLLAAEILLPYNALVDEFSPSSLSMARLKAIARRYEVSQMALLRRIADVTDVPVVYLNVVPYRFNDLDSAAEIDNAIYATPRRGTLDDRDGTYFVQRCRYREIVKQSRFRSEITGAKGRFCVEFDVWKNDRPVPNVDLLAIECAPQCERAQAFLNSKADG